MQRSSGFTLVELSIVIAVIALILGGISVGGSLIRNAEIQGATGESARHIQAIKSFHDKYAFMPGDFSNASNLFNGATNGNGDGLVSGAEQFYAWYHLAAAKLVEGSFTGTAGGGGSSDRIPGTNVPTSQLSGAGWGLVYAATTNNYLLYVTGDTPPGHVLWFGGRSTSGTDDEQNPVLTSEEAEQLDRKIDDGVPGTGKIVAQDNSSGTECHSSTSLYNVTASDNICALVFKTGY